MRLNVFMAKSGFCSRRKADSFIKNGKARVGGKVVCQPWFEVRETDSVEVNGRFLRPDPRNPIYLVFNKPKGVTTTLKDRFARRKITDFIPKKFGRLYPVGRLDKDSRGLIILTNNGDFCYRLTHPKFEVEKEYILWLKGKISAGALKSLKKGVEENGDMLKVKSASIEASKAGKTKVKVVVCEGKKRHLRRLFEALGFPVLDLKRVRISDLRLGNLREGSFKVCAQGAFFNRIGGEVQKKAPNSLTMR